MTLGSSHLSWNYSSRLQNDGFISSALVGALVGTILPQVGTVGGACLGVAAQFVANNMITNPSLQHLWTSVGKHVGHRIGIATQGAMIGAVFGGISGWAMSGAFGQGVVLGMGVGVASGTRESFLTTPSHRSHVVSLLTLVGGVWLATKFAESANVNLWPIHKLVTGALVYLGTTRTLRRSCACPSGLSVTPP